MAQGLSGGSPIFLLGFNRFWLNGDVAVNADVACFWWCLVLSLHLLWWWRRRAADLGTFRQRRWWGDVGRLVWVGFGLCPFVVLGFDVFLGVPYGLGHGGVFGFISYLVWLFLSLGL